MISPKDWRTYTQQVDMYEGMRINRVLDLVVQCGAATHTASLALRSYSPKYKRTLEGCLDWIVAGRPTIARKLKVT